MATATPGFATQQEAYAALIRQGADQRTATILAAITRPESSGYTAATGHYQGNTYNGLWQIGMGPSYSRPYDINRLRSDDIDYQAAAALDVYRAQGFQAWETYTNGSYQKYLGQYNAPALGDMSGDTSGLDSLTRIPVSSAPMAQQMPSFLSRGMTPLGSPEAVTANVGPAAGPAAVLGSNTPDPQNNPIHAGEAFNDQFGTE
jgi:hypothetical protein